jgi:threonyl-tRNA synthetase
MKITLPDGSIKDLPAGSTPADVAASIGAGLAKAAIGAKVNGQLWDLHRPLPLPPGEGRGEGAPDDSAPPIAVSIVTRPKQGKDGRSTFRDAQHEKDALYLLRHSTAHVMAEAIERVYGKDKVKLAYGPPLDTGFYYDIALDTPISTNDFPRIETEMKKIVAENRLFMRYELPPAEGMKKLDAEGNKYKLDNARRAIDGGAVALSWYITGQFAPGESPGANWEDLCQGPHVPATAEIGAFKVTSVATSHWHGDVTSDRFQRVYGTAFFTQADLDHHVAQLEEARQRDHRVVGQRLGLFTIDDMVGQGLILWKPKGAIVRQELQKFIGEHLQRQGYAQVFTPHIGRLDLFKTSGHFPYYQESQYPPLIDSDQLRRLAEEKCSCADLANHMKAGDLDGYLLKPMNCPFHIRIYKSEKRSYRELPIRLAEFGTVYRWEQSGELNGMTRVRGFTQDDAHLFVTEEQLDAEVLGCLELVKIVLGTLGMSDYRVRVGLRDPAPGKSDKFVGDPRKWDAAGAALERAVKTLGVPYTAEPGEAAFYGPKIDFVVRDVIGREWQLGTVQVDYVLPERFDLSYVGSDNAEHRPVMIHRAPFGSMERFCGVLIEHFNGAFPLWLSPEQVRVLPISDKFLGYASQVHQALTAGGFRATLDDANDRINAKIKVAQDEKIPYMLVVGGKDEQAGTVSVRHRTEGDRGAVALDTFLAQITTERDGRKL